MYGSVGESITFLSDTVWTSLSSTQQAEYLEEAARLIDELNYYAQKKDSTQEHEFPRTNETEVPSDIENASYYIALELAKGFDSELEANSFGGISQSVGKAGKNNKSRPEHIVAGIPSFRAWRLLFKYLRVPTVQLNRIS